MDSLNLLYIMHECAMGGASKSGIEMVRLAAKNHKVNVIVKSFSGEVYQELKKIDNIKIIVSLPYFWWKFNPTSKNIISKLKKYLYYTNFTSIVYILMILRKTSIDIVHSNSSVIDIGAKIAKAKGAKHIWHLREFGEIDQGSQFIKKERISYKYMQENTDLFLCISNSIKDFYKKYIDENKLKVVYNGVDTSKKYLKNNEYSDTLHFIMCSSLQQGKGHLDAIKAFMLLKEKGIMTFHLKIIGKNINNYKDILVNEVNRCNLKDYIEFIEYSNDIFLIRKNMDVELVCSTKEPFGRVTIESMLCSNPVIVSNSGANVELVQNEINGFVYQQGNSGDLARKLEYILKNKDILYAIRKNAYYDALEFSSIKNFKEIEKLYYELLNNNN